VRFPSLTFFECAFKPSTIILSAPWSPHLLQVRLRALNHPFKCVFEPSTILLSAPLSPHFHSSAPSSPHFLRVRLRALTSFRVRLQALIFFSSAPLSPHLGDSASLSPIMSSL
jgi:hypothetical protein